MCESIQPILLSGIRNVHLEHSRDLVELTYSRHSRPSHNSTNQRRRSSSESINTVTSFGANQLSTKLSISGNFNSPHIETNVSPWESLGKSLNQTRGTLLNVMEFLAEENYVETETNVNCIYSCSDSTAKRKTSMFHCRCFPKFRSW